MALTSRIVRYDIQDPDGTSDPVPLDLHIRIESDDADTAEVFGAREHLVRAELSRSAIADLARAVKATDVKSFPEGKVVLPVEKFSK